jgi:hypothetical protein
VLTKPRPLTLTLVCGIFLAGCVTPPTYQISGEILSKSSFELIDKRDEAQKKSEVMSYLISSCWAGVFRLGDDQIVPSRLTFLAKELYEKVDPKSQDKKVIVNRFEIFNNTALSKVSTYGLFGVGSGTGCESAFSPDKNPANLPAIVVNVDLEIDGKRIRDKIVQIEPVGDDRINGPITTERVRRAMAASVKRIVDLASQ